MRKNSVAAFVFVCCVLGGMRTGVAADEVGYDSGKRRDPFVKLSSLGTAVPTIGGVGGHLQGIIYDPQKTSFAIFGGKTFMEGESVGDSKIKKILKDHVVIEVNGEEKKLRIREEEKSRAM